MLDHKQIDAITFNGSVSTGRRVAAACAGLMRKSQLEMGARIRWSCSRTLTCSQSRGQS
jgi:hypothetical protein